MEEVGGFLQEVEASPTSVEVDLVWVDFPTAVDSLVEVEEDLVVVLEVVAKFIVTCTCTWHQMNQLTLKPV